MRRRPGDGFKLVELFVRGEFGAKSVLVPEEELHPSQLWGEEAAVLAVARVPQRTTAAGGTVAPTWAVRLLRAAPSGYRVSVLDLAAEDEEFRAAALSVLDLGASAAEGGERLVELARGCL